MLWEWFCLEDFLFSRRLPKLIKQKQIAFHEKNFLNAREDEGVKRMNIGLPDKALNGFGRTMLYEDGVPVLMEYAYQTPLMYSFMGLNIGETEIYRDGEALIIGGNTGYIQ